MDYVLHVATHYVSVSDRDRSSRTDRALSEMATSILGAGFTTFGSMAFLLACNFVVYFKFGVFITLSVPFSLLFSLVFFPALLHTIGPEKQCGDLRQVCSKCISKRKTIADEHV